MRDYTEQKSLFCNPSTALEELDKIAQQGKYKTLVLSYNSEGIMPQEAIIQTLSQYGKVTLTQFDYQRFKSNNNGESQSKKYIQEQLYILKRQWKTYTYSPKNAQKSVSSLLSYKNLAPTKSPLLYW